MARLLRTLISRVRTKTRSQPIKAKVTDVGTVGAASLKRPNPPPPSRGPGRTLISTHPQGKDPARPAASVTADGVVRQLAASLRGIVGSSVAQTQGGAITYFILFLFSSSLRPGTPQPFETICVPYPTHECAKPASRTWMDVS